MDPKLIQQIEEPAEESDRFTPNAFLWVIRVLDHTRRRLKRDGHISGRELLEGHRDLALEEFGPMAFEVLNHWGLRETEDVGRVVFALVESEILSRTDEDRLEDFTGLYDFRQVFLTDYPW